MRLVKQEDSMGCGIACVAFVLDISYKDAVKLFTLPEKRKTLGYRSSELREALYKAGYRSLSTYVGGEDMPVVKTGDIIYVKKCTAFPYGHYLVKIESGYMDPFINMTETKGDHSKARAGKRFMLPGKITMIVTIGSAH